MQWLERMSELSGDRSLFLEEINHNSYRLQWYTINSFYVTSLLKRDQVYKPKLTVHKKFLYRESSSVWCHIVAINIILMVFTSALTAIPCII